MNNWNEINNAIFNIGLKLFDREFKGPFYLGRHSITLIFYLYFCSLTNPIKTKIRNEERMKICPLKKEGEIWSKYKNTHIQRSNMFIETFTYIHKHISNQTRRKGKRKDYEVYIVCSCIDCGCYRCTRCKFETCGKWNMVSKMPKGYRPSPSMVKSWREMAGEDMKLSYNEYLAHVKKQAAAGKRKASMF